MYTWLQLRSLASSVEAGSFFGFLYVSSKHLVETFTDPKQELGVIAYRLIESTASSC